MALYLWDKPQQINDRFGHVAGDAFVATDGALSARFAFEAYRLGGDEFVVIYQDDAEQDCLLLVEQLHSEFIKHELWVANRISLQSGDNRSRGCPPKSG